MDIRNPRLLYTKAALFVVAGVTASGLLLAEHPGLRTIDDGYRFAGLLSFARYWLGRKRRS